MHFCSQLRVFHNSQFGIQNLSRLYYSDLELAELENEQKLSPFHSYWDGSNWNGKIPSLDIHHQYPKYWKKNSSSIFFPSSRFSWRFSYCEGQIIIIVILIRCYFLFVFCVTSCQESAAKQFGSNTKSSGGHLCFFCCWNHGQCVIIGPPTTYKPGQLKLRPSENVIKEMVSGNIPPRERESLQIFVLLIAHFRNIDRKLGICKI